MGVGVSAASRKRASATALLLSIMWVRGPASIAGSAHGIHGGAVGRPASAAMLDMAPDGEKTSWSANCGGRFWLNAEEAHQAAPATHSARVASATRTCGA